MVELNDGMKRVADERVALRAVCVRHVMDASRDFVPNGAETAAGLGL